MATPAIDTPSPVKSGITPLPPTTPGSASGSDSAGATIAGNFQTFLTILTTQLQNQNPLDPLDTNQFTQQLVQFAGVEQQLKTNDQIGKLIAAQQSTQSVQALELTGKVAVVDGDTTSLTNHQALWNLDIPGNTNKITAIISSKTGETVFSHTYNAGEFSTGDNQPFPWDGTGTDGSQVADGQYRLTVTATDFAGNTVGIKTQIGARVDSVDLTQSPPLLSIGGQSYTIDQIKSLLN